eukprot:TRINITY_DN2965_c0_g4_i1.p1 TRINITY_DN2965_c0_g4~~TRINITY_DN2965_c0_g4_i1.p1  ORF type:complete len:130 (+),score=13.29 TRINITY_DN2965_c0_g4_i1:503-892(+)
MGKKSDISDVIRHIRSVEDWQKRSPLMSLLTLLEDESIFINIEAIDLNIVLRSTPELNKLQIERIKKHKRLLRKRVTKKAFEARTKTQNCQLSLDVEDLKFEKRRLLREKNSLESEVSTYRQRSESDQQ